LDWKNIVEIRDFREGEAGIWVGTTSLGVEGLSATDWKLTPAFSFGFTAAGCSSIAVLDSGFLGLAV
jgi:hypothetical protein